MNGDLQKEMLYTKALVDAHLESFFLQKMREISALSSGASQLVEQIRDLTLRGGDRIRPFLFLLSYQAFGGKEMQSIIPFAAGLEMFQSFALIHDDIMDRSTLRRGGPSVHEFFHHKFGDFHTGESVGLLAGDLVLTWSNSLLFRKYNLSQKQEELVKTGIVLMEEEVVWGQLADISLAASDLANHATLSDNELLQLLYEYKTARYSVEKPLWFGGVFASAPIDVLKVLSHFGLLTGQAFQLRDDVLGVFGDQNQTGKSSSSDLTEEKFTLLIKKTLERLERKDSSYFISIFQKKQKSDNDIVSLRTFIQNSGALNVVEHKAEAFIDEAIQLLSLLPISDASKEKMVSFARFCIEREE